MTTNRGTLPIAAIGALATTIGRGHVAGSFACMLATIEQLATHSLTLPLDTGAQRESLLGPTLALLNSC